ncbi:MAG: glutamine amidotransferase [Devosiaceae bacterium]|nr:glutamine amidotransferase [Devosiaceae bacterium MH13]
MAPKKPILVVLHQEHSTPGRVGRKLVERGHALDVRKPRFGDPLPPTLEGHGGAIIFGGPMSAYDDEPFLKTEADWLDVPLREGAPFLGLCLGAQLLAQHLGATVAPDPGGEVEIGYYPLRPTPQGQALMDWPSMVYQWHRDGFGLPSGATRLATSDGAFPEQAFRVGAAAVGLQFHPEMTAAMIYKWTVKGAERMACPGAQSRREHLEGRLLYEPALDAWLDGFLDRWLARDMVADSAPIGVAAE